MIDYDYEEGWPQPQPQSTQDEMEAMLVWTIAGLKCKVTQDSGVEQRIAELKVCHA